MYVIITDRDMLRPDWKELPRDKVIKQYISLSSPLSRMATIYLNHTEVKTVKL